MLGPEAAGGSWALWETLAKKDSHFGRPAVFNSNGRGIELDFFHNDPARTRSFSIL